MNSSLPGNNTTMVNFDASPPTTTVLTSSDHVLDFWSRASVVTSTAISLPTTPSTTAALLVNDTTMRFMPVFESPIVFSVKLALFMMVHSPLGTACVQGCSSVLKSSLTSIVGSSHDEMLAPFHSVIAKSRTNIAAQRKVAWVCHSMRKFRVCMEPCLDSKAKAIRMISVQQWELICEASKKYPKHFGEFIGCEKRHHERAIHKCPPLKVLPDTSLDSFCRSINSYVDCYSAVPFRCNSKNATQIWTIINGAIKQSYGRILEVTAGRLELPVECEWAMRNEDLYRHEQEENRMEKDQFLFESLSWSTTPKPIKSTPINRHFEPFPSSGTPTVQSTPTHFTHPQHKHREFDNDEYNVDYWQGVSEQPMLHPLPTAQTTRQLWTSTDTLTDNQRTPFLANAFKNGLSPTKCSILVITSMLLIYQL